MQYSPHLPVVYIDLGKIVENYRRLLRSSAAALAGPGDVAASAPPLPPEFCDAPGGVFTWPSQMAVIKADAYGHGHIQVAKALLAEGCAMFASGSVQEAAQLRRGIENLAAEKLQAASRPLILSLLGLVSREDVFTCAEHGIVPVVHSFEQIDMLGEAERTLPVALKCNTGMSRLGFNEEEIPALVERLSATPGVTPVILLSHLHSADTGEGRSRIAVQAAVYGRILAALRARWPRLAASLGNSAGTLLAEDIAGHIGPHVCRPGIALYGGNPFAETPLAPLGRGLVTAMCVQTPVIAVRDLAPGAGVGYGHTFTAAKPMRIGIIAAGYADCFSRGLSNKGEVCVDGARARVVGRVSMQMTAVDLGALPQGSGTPGRARPASAWILGGPHDNAVSVEELARVWGTITYEVLCLLGYNTRVYGPYPTS